MRVAAVIPTILGREEMFAQAIASYEAAGIETVGVYNSPSCGAGWRIGLEQTDAEIVWLVADDTLLVNNSGLEEAIEWANAGRIVSPGVLWPGGGIQGFGGMGREIPHGGVAVNAIFPLASRDTFAAVGEWPALNHFCDCWITKRAAELGAGPIVSRTLTVTHKIISPIAEEEYAVYDSWLAERG